ncbi:MAG: hypothetical protein QE263_07290 [Vampirovibrionales bacterium]|nr:hypothetical protein [Vampirovibrionales bacterium]
MAIETDQSDVDVQDAILDAKVGPLVKGVNRLGHDQPVMVETNKPDTQDQTVAEALANLGFTVLA